MPKLLVPLSILLQYLFGEARGVYFLDATKISICHCRREKKQSFRKDCRKKAKFLWAGFFGSSYI